MKKIVGLLVFVLLTTFIHAIAFADDDFFEIEIKRDGNWISTESTHFDINDNPPSKLRLVFNGEVKNGKLIINGEEFSYRDYWLELHTSPTITDDFDISDPTYRGNYELLGILINGELHTATFQVTYYSSATGGEPAYMTDTFRWKSIYRGGSKIADVGQDAGFDYIDLDIYSYEQFSNSFDNNTARGISNQAKINDEFERLVDILGEDNLTVDGQTPYVLEGAGVITIRDGDGNVVESSIELQSGLTDARNAWERAGSVATSTMITQWNDRINLSTPYTPEREGEFEPDEEDLIPPEEYEDDPVSGIVSLNFFDLDGNQIHPSDYSNQLMFEDTHDKNISIPNIPNYNFEHFNVRVREENIEERKRERETIITLTRDVRAYDLDIYYSEVETHDTVVNIRYFNVENNNRLRDTDRHTFTVVEGENYSPSPSFDIPQINGYSYQSYNVRGRNNEIFSNRIEDSIDFNSLGLLLSQEFPEYNIDIYYSEIVPLDLSVRILRHSQPQEIPYSGQFRDFEIDFEVKLEEGTEIPEDIKYRIHFNGSLREENYISGEHFSNERRTKQIETIIGAATQRNNTIRIEINPERRIEETNYGNNSEERSFSSDVLSLDRRLVYGGASNQSFAQRFTRSVRWRTSRRVSRTRRRPDGTTYRVRRTVYTNHSGTRSKTETVNEKVEITGIRYRSKLTEDIMELVREGRSPQGFNNNMHVGNDWFDLLNSAKDFGYIKAGYGFELEVDLTYETNIPQVFRDINDWTPTRPGGFTSIGSPSPRSYSLPSLPSELSLRLPAQNRINTSRIQSAISRSNSDDSGSSLSTSNLIETIKMERVPGSTRTTESNGVYYTTATYRLPQNPAFNNTRKFYIPDDIRNMDLYFFVTNGFEGGGLSATFSPSKAGNNDDYYDSKWFRIKVDGSRFDDLTIIR